MVADPSPDYCPFCGGRLRDEEGALRSHLGIHDDCRERYETWGDEWFQAATVGNDPGARRSRRLRRFVVWTVIAIVLGYSVLVAQQILLGVVAAGIIYAAFSWIEPGHLR